MSEPIKTGGPAFPRPAGDYSGTKHGNGAQSGMSLRDYFAAHALAGLCANERWNATYQVEKVASSAYAMADAMLRNREGGAR